MSTPHDAEYKIRQRYFRAINKASNKMKHDKWKAKGEAWERKSKGAK